MSETTASKERKLLFFSLAQSPRGLCLRDIPGHEDRQVREKSVHALRNAGLIFSVETGWRETRWFDTRARADAYLVANPFVRVGREARRGGARVPEGPAVNTVQVQVCPGIERRYQPVRVTQPVFSAMRPGVYLDR